MFSAPLRGSGTVQEYLHIIESSCYLDLNVLFQHFVGISTVPGFPIFKPLKLVSLSGGNRVRRCLGTKRGRGTALCQPGFVFYSPPMLSGHKQKIQ